MVFTDFLVQSQTRLYIPESCSNFFKWKRCVHNLKQKSKCKIGNEIYSIVIRSLVGWIFHRRNVQLHILKFDIVWLCNLSSPCSVAYFEISHRVVMQFIESLFVKFSIQSRIVGFENLKLQILKIFRNMINITLVKFSFLKKSTIKIKIIINAIRVRCVFSNYILILVARRCL